MNNRNCSGVARAEREVSANSHKVPKKPNVERPGRGIGSTE